MQAIERSIEKDGALICSIVKQHFKTATGCDQKLMTLFVGMRATSLSTRNIKRIKNTFYIERHVFVGMDWRYITCPVFDSRQFYD